MASIICIVGATPVILHHTYFVHLSCLPLVVVSKRSVLTLPHSLHSIANLLCEIGSILFFLLLNSLHKDAIVYTCIAQRAVMGRFIYLRSEPAIDADCVKYMSADGYLTD